MTNATDPVLIVDLLSQLLQLFVAGRGLPGARRLLQINSGAEEAVDDDVGIATDGRGEVGVAVQGQT